MLVTSGSNIRHQHRCSPKMKYQRNRSTQMIIFYLYQSEEDRKDEFNYRNDVVHIVRHLLQRECFSTTIIIP